MHILEPEEIGLSSQPEDYLKDIQDKIKDIKKATDILLDLLKEKGLKNDQATS